jgi:hypothetical protein
MMPPSTSRPSTAVLPLVGAAAGRAGLLLALVLPQYQPTAALSTANSDFLLYETGGTGFGLRMEYADGGAAPHVFENYATPVDEWFHLSFGVSKTGADCVLSSSTASILAENHPQASAACGATGALRSFGSAAMQLRAGMAFGGEINDVLVWRAAQTQVRARMHRVVDVSAATPRLFAAFTFDNTDPNDPTVVLDATGQQRGLAE